jgi:hypothetical protein
VSARHSLADRTERKRRRDASRVRGYRLPSRVSTPLASAGIDTQPGRDARQWNAVNVPRLYELKPLKDGRRLVRGRDGKPVMARVRTSFRNVIDEQGRHV